MLQICLRRAPEVYGAGRGQGPEPAGGTGGQNVRRDGEEGPAVRLRPCAMTGSWDLLLSAVGGAPTSGWPSRNQWAVSSLPCPSAHSYRTLATEHEALTQKYLHLVQVVETEKTVARQLRQQIEDGEMEIERLKAEVTAGRGPTPYPCTPRLLQGRGPRTGWASSSQPQPCQPPNLQPGILAEWGGPVVRSGFRSHHCYLRLHARARPQALCACSSHGLFTLTPRGCGR